MARDNRNALDMRMLLLTIALLASCRSEPRRDPNRLARDGYTIVNRSGSVLGFGLGPDKGTLEFRFFDREGYELNLTPEETLSLSVELSKASADRRKTIVADSETAAMLRRKSLHR